MNKLLHFWVSETVSYERNIFKFPKKIFFFLMFLISFSASEAYCKSKEIQYLNKYSTIQEDAPIDVIVGNAAPHIPIMIKINNQENETKYNNEENLKAIKVWISSYPNEVANYKKIIVQALDSVEVKSLSPIFSSIYNDTKTQYKLIASLLKW